MDEMNYDFQALALESRGMGEVCLFQHFNANAIRRFSIFVCAVPDFYSNVDYSWVFQL